MRSLQHIECPSNTGWRVRSCQLDPSHFGTPDDLQRAGRSGSAGILLIGCSDDNGVADLLPCEFSERCAVLQYPACAIPPAAEVSHSLQMASIEHFVGLRPETHIVVCGHFGCRVIGDAAIGRSAMLLGRTSTDRLQGMTRLLVQRYPFAGAGRLHRLLVQRFALQQIEHLATHPFIRERLADHRLRLHVWMNHAASSGIVVYSATADRFVAIR